MKARHMKTAHPKSYYKRVAAGALVAALLLTQAAPVFAEGGSALETGSSESILETLAENLLNEQEEDASTIVEEQVLSLNANKAQAEADSESEAESESEAASEGEATSEGEAASEGEATSEGEAASESEAASEDEAGAESEAGSESEAAPEEETEETEETKRTLETLERPDQSDTVTTLVGNGEDSAEGADGTGNQVNENTNWSVFYDKETGYYNVTFRIDSDAEGDQVIEISQAMAVLRTYAIEQQGQTGYIMEPGDIIPFQIYIESDSDHIYRYIDGSFVLATTDLGTTDEDGDIVATVDAQVLPSYYTNQESVTLGYSYIAYSTKSVDVLTNATSDADIEENLFVSPIQALVYRAQEASYEELKALNSAKSNPDTYINKTWLSRISNENLTDAQRYAIQALSSSNSVYYSNSKAVIAYLNENYGGSYEAYLLDYYSTKDDTEYADFDDLVLNSTIAKDLKATTTGRLTDANAQYVTVTFPENMLYDNFYKNLLSVLYGNDDIEEIAQPVYEEKKLTPQQLAHALTGYSYWDDQDDETVKAAFSGIVASIGCTLDDLCYYYRDSFGNEGTIFSLPYDCEYDAELGKFYCVDANGDPYLDENGEIYYLEIVKAYSYYNTSWEYTGNDYTVGDYMASMLTESGVWEKANNYFKDLLAAGVSSDEATWRAFRMALNVDGQLTGNTYEDSIWRWYNSIILTRADGDLTIHKEDEDGNALAGAGFELWEIRTTTKEDGTEETVKEYFFGTPVYEKDADGNDTDTVLYYKGVFHTKDDETESCVLYTDASGNIYVRFLDEEGGDDGQYHLQEVVAPDGYVLDDTVYDIVIKAGETTEITVVNHKDTPDTPDTPTPVPSTEIVPEEPTPETNGTTTIEDTPVPVAELPEPEEELIEDEQLQEEPQVPLASGETINSTVPETGDDTPLWAATALLALLGLLALAAADRKKPCKH